MAQVKGTDKELLPVLVSTMDKLEAKLRPLVAPWQSTQAAAAYRVKRNREIAAGGLLDEQQKMVLDLHSLVDECGDNNGTVEKEEIEAACGDKRGKFFEKLDVDTDGHVDAEEFLNFFEQMSIKRGRKAAESLLSFVEKGVEKLKEEQAKKAAEASAAESELETPRTYDE